jgi:hypothetical protein
MMSQRQGMESDHQIVRDTLTEDSPNRTGKWIVRKAASSVRDSSPRGQLLEMVAKLPWMSEQWKQESYGHRTGDPSSSATGTELLENPYGFPELELSHRHVLNAAHDQLRTDYQALKQADVKVQKTLALLSSGNNGSENNLSNWSKLCVGSQVLLKQLRNFSSPDRQQARASLQDETNALVSMHDQQLDSNTQNALQEAGDILQTLEKTQEMEQYAQTIFVQSSKAIRTILYTDKIRPGTDFEDYIPPFIKRYTDSNPEHFYRLITKIKAEQTKDGHEKMVGINYYSPLARIFIAYSNSREDQAQSLKPLYEGETKEEIYQRTVAHSEEMYHIQKATVSAHNQENPEKEVSLQNIPNLTIVRHSLANETYRAVRPSLNLIDRMESSYTQENPEFQLLMDKVPNFKAVKRLLSQHYPHLEVQRITILPHPSADAAILYASTKTAIIEGGNEHGDLLI